MKSFLLRFKGTIFASAQIQKMMSKWVKKIMWSTFTGRLTEFELKNPPWDFHGLKNTCSFTCKPTTKSIESCVYFTNFFGFRFLTRVPTGNYLPVWAQLHTLYTHCRRWWRSISWNPKTFFSGRQICGLIAVCGVSRFVEYKRDRWSRVWWDCGR